jgi:hypothetical protein
MKMSFIPNRETDADERDTDDIVWSKNWNGVKIVCLCSV